MGRKKLILPSHPVANNSASRRNRFPTMSPSSNEVTLIQAALRQFSECNAPCGSFDVLTPT